VRTATAAGAALLIGTLGITVGVLVGAASSARVLLGFAFPSVPVVIWLPVVLTVVAAVGLAFFAIGVRFSTRVTLIVELLAVLTIVAIMSIMIVVNWGVLPPVVPSDADPAAIGAGAAVAVGLFVGFETSATLGAEARRPFRDVPRSFVLSVVIAALIFALSFFGQYAGFQSGGAFTAVGDVDPSRPGTSILVVVALDLGILLSYLAAFVASLNGVIRLVFTLSRDGLLPAALGRVDRRNRLPMRAAVWVAVLVLVTAVVATSLTAGSESVTGVALSTSAVGCGLAYAIACLLLPRFRRRIGEPLLSASIAAYAVGAALVGVVLCFVVWNLVAGILAVLVPVALIAALWAVFALTARRREIVQIGVYDQTAEHDLVPDGVEARFRSPADRVAGP
jgi:amino acid transporter